MPKEYHIVFGRVAEAVLKQSKVVDFSKENVELIVLMDNLGLGRLYNLKTLVDVGVRINWFEGFYNELGQFNYVEEHAIEVSTKLNEINSDDAVFIWLGNESNEYTWKASIIDFLQDINVNIYVIDWTEVSLINKYGNVVSPYSLNICDINYIPELTYFKSLSKDKKLEWSRIWNRMYQSNADLRILNNGRLEEGDVSFLDDMLLANCTTDFQKCAYVVGMTLGDCYEKYNESGIGDSFLFERLEQLGTLGKLEIEDLILRKPDASNLFNVRLKN